MTVEICYAPFLGAIVVRVVHCTPNTIFVPENCGSFFFARHAFLGLASIPLGSARRARQLCLMGQAPIPRILRDKRMGGFEVSDIDHKKLQKFKGMSLTSKPPIRLSPKIRGMGA